MSQENRIHIDYQCHQPFWNFKKKDGKQFCKQCKHTIHDFTQSTAEEIILYLQQNNRKACGTFYKDQVNRSEQTKHSPATYKIALASLISFFAATEIDAQSTVTDSVKTEQRVATPSGNADVIYNVDQKGNDVTTCPINTESEPVVHVRRHGKHLSIGSYYINWRFPFIHRYRMGRIRY